MSCESQEKASPASVHDLIDTEKCDTQMNTTRKPSEVPRVQPAFPDCSDAIVFCINDYFCPYLSVMLYSVLEHASASGAYDIVILHRDITPENQEILRNMAAARDNVSIRFLNVTALVEVYSLYTGGKEDFSVDAYLRLLIPDVLDLSYHKALYLDADMLALADIGELLDTDLDGFLLASSRDLSGLGTYYDPKDDRKAYRDRVLKLERPEDYFIDGMLVFNLDAFRREYTSEALFELAASRDWRQHDQDVLNLICDGGRARLLHAQWDVLKPYRPELLPQPYRIELEEAAAAPRIIHFGGDEKPWKNTSSPWNDLFWETAVKTPYYKEIIYRILSNGLTGESIDKNNQIVSRVNNGQVRFSHLVHLNALWIKFKLRSYFCRKRR